MQLQSRVKTKLGERFSPIVLEVTNESSMHNVPPGSETHLRVVLVSAAFCGKSPVERHRLVYDTVAEEFKDGLHALTVTSRSPEEWELNREVGTSPACHGGSKR
jgi:stress-induced morphogen